jgi:hypothetical protein
VVVLLVVVLEAVLPEVASLSGAASPEVLLVAVSLQLVEVLQGVLLVVVSPQPVVVLQPEQG